MRAIINIDCAVCFVLSLSLSLSLSGCSHLRGKEFTRNFTAKIYLLELCGLEIRWWCGAEGAKSFRIHSDFGGHTEREVVAWIVCTACTIHKTHTTRTILTTHKPHPTRTIPTTYKTHPTHSHNAVEVPLQMEGHS